MLARSVSVVTLFLGMSSCGPAPEADTNVVYGQDDRKEPWDPAVDPVLRNAARSTALVTDRTSLAALPDGNYRLQTQNYGEESNLCAEEPFANQPTGGWCSAFLVGPDLMATAGHCIQDLRICKASAFVFDFAYASADASGLDQVAAENVYHCTKIVGRVYSRSGADYAVVQLDRPVAGRTPLTVRRTGEIGKDETVAAIGHPSGLPQKITDNGTLRPGGGNDYFSANLDTFGGNSGSAVINRRTGVVEGILVRGERDFEATSRGCYVSYHCDEGRCRGEDVVRATSFAHLVPEPAVSLSAR